MGAISSLHPPVTGSDTTFSPYGSGEWKPPGQCQLIPLNTLPIFAEWVGASCVSPDRILPSMPASAGLVYDNGSEVWFTVKGLSPDNEQVTKAVRGALDDEQTTIEIQVWDNSGEVK
jgi:hypothetical protein